MTRRAVLPLLAGASVGRAADTFEAFGMKWRVPIGADWKVESAPEGEQVNLLVPRPSLSPRRPSQYALAETPDYGKLTLELEARKEPFEARKRRTSLMFVYAWKDENHFNYAHISVDAAREQAVHNGIFHVYGGERVRISSIEGPGALKDESWHKVRLEYDASKGLAQVWVNGETSPSLKAVDLSLGAGRFGFGSFFDLGSFRKLRVQDR